MIAKSIGAAPLIYDALTLGTHSLDKNKYCPPLCQLGNGPATYNCFHCWAYNWKKSFSIICLPNRANQLIREYVIAWRDNTKITLLTNLNMVQFSFPNIYLPSVRYEYVSLWEKCFRDVNFNRGQLVNKFLDPLCDLLKTSRLRSRSHIGRTRSNTINLVLQPSRTQGKDQGLAIQLLIELLR